VCRVQVVNGDVIGEQTAAADLLVTGVYAGNIGAMDTVLVFAIKVHALAVVHGVPQYLAGVNFETVEPSRWFLFEATNGDRLATDLAFQYLAYRLCIHLALRRLVFWLSR
jgi:hypothetical protein